MISCSSFTFSAQRRPHPAAPLDSHRAFHHHRRSAAVRRGRVHLLHLHHASPHRPSHSHRARWVKHTHTHTRNLLFRCCQKTEVATFFFFSGLKINPGSGSESHASLTAALNRVSRSLREREYVFFFNVNFFFLSALQDGLLSLRPVLRFHLIPISYLGFSQNVVFVPAEAKWCGVTFLPSLCSYSGMSPLRLIDGCTNQFHCSRSSFCSRNL